MRTITLIILIIILFYLYHRLISKENFDTDPGGFSRYDSQLSAPQYQYDSHPLYGSYA